MSCTNKVSGCTRRFLVSEIRNEGPAFSASTFQEVLSTTGSVAVSPEGYESHFG
jgi:hypothetical protein